MSVFKASCTITLEIPVEIPVDTGLFGSAEEAMFWVQDVAKMAVSNQLREPKGTITCISIDDESDFYSRDDEFVS